MVAKKDGGKKKDKEDEEKKEEEKEEKKEDDEEDAGKKKKRTPKKPADDFPKGKRKWYYDPLTSGLTTEVMGIKAEITIFGQPKNWAEVELSPLAK